MVQKVFCINLRPRKSENLKGKNIRAGVERSKSNVEEVKIPISVFRRPKIRQLRALLPKINGSKKSRRAEIEKLMYQRVLS